MVVAGLLVFEAFVGLGSMVLYRKYFRSGPRGPVAAASTSRPGGIPKASIAYITLIEAGDPSSANSEPMGLPHI